MHLFIYIAAHEIQCKIQGINQINGVMSIIINIYINETKNMETTDTLHKIYRR